MRTICLLLFLCFRLASQAQLAAALDSFLLQQNPSAPGFALRIEKKGELLYQRAVGIANDTTGEPIDSTTNFRMASVSKQFTAMAVLLLEKEHRLSFDDPIGKYLPGLPVGVGKQVHIRHLLTHSSGILDYETLIPASQTAQLLDADVLQLLTGHDSTYFIPGSRFRYSNSGYCLLALIVERVSKQSFASFIKDRIFTPLQMAHSVVYQAVQSIPHRAMGYAKDRAGHVYFADQSLTSATKGDGGVYTSLTDYGKWIKALQENRLVKLPAIIKRLQFPLGAEQAPPQSFYAAGWFWQSTSPALLFHSGSTCGFSNFVIQLPGDEWCISWFSNLAGNTVVFSGIVQVLERYGFAGLSRVFSLHELTR